ncbi:MAG: hypothetical protein ACREID_09770, partial [Planctomycetota bacterium]
VLGGEPLAFAAPGAVLAAAPSWVALGFDPDRCVLAASPSYPLFLRNAVALLGRASPSREPEFFAIGERAPLRGLAELPDGRSARVGERLLGPPGFWRLGDRTLAVNLLLPDLDLAPPGVPSDPLPPVGAQGTPDRPLAPLFAGAALALLLVAWWAFWRG